jgi:hypothetical protein
MVCRVKENAQIHIVKRDQLVRRNRPVFNSLNIACVGSSSVAVLPKPFAQWIVGALVLHISQFYALWYVVEVESV